LALFAAAFQEKMETQELVLRLRERGIIEGPDHFVLGDGYGNPDKHCSLFVMEERLYSPRNHELLSLMLENILKQLEGVSFDCIVATNSQSLQSARELAEIACSKSGRPSMSAMAFDPESMKKCSGRILLHDDVINMGRQISDIIAAISRSNLRVAAVSSLFTRVSGGTIFGLPIKTAIERQLVCYPGENCPLCRQRLPINTKLSKGDVFLEQRKHLHNVRG